MDVFGRAYQKSFSPAPSSHCKCFTLIRCSGNLDPQIHRFVDRTKVIPIQILMYPHVLYYGCCHFVVRRLAILFRVASASAPNFASTEM